MRIIRIEIRGLVGGREGCEEELYVLIPIFLLPSYSLSSRFFPTTECFMDLDKRNLFMEDWFLGASKVVTFDSKIIISLC